MNNQQILQQIGLTYKEAEVYQLLLKAGESSVYQLIKETHDHPQIIYRAIEGLTKKKLATSVLKKHKRFIQAVDPQIIEEEEEKRLEEIRQALPSLIALKKETKEAIVKVIRGDQGVRDFRLDIIGRLKEDQAYYVIGASGDRYFEVMGSLYAKAEKDRLKKKFYRYLLTSESQRENLEQDPFQEMAEFRYLPESYSIASTTMVADKTVGTYIWDIEPITITIESELVAESYLQQFKALWQIAKV